jgi:hypothetical protein
MQVFPRKFSRTIARERRYQIITTLPPANGITSPHPAPAGPSAGNGLQGLARVARAWHPRRPLVGYVSEQGTSSAAPMPWTARDTINTPAARREAAGDGCQREQRQPAEIDCAGARGERNVHRDPPAVCTGG